VIAHRHSGFDRVDQTEAANSPQPSYIDETMIRGRIIGCTLGDVGRNLQHNLHQG
jgi:hypothetical protein